MKHTYTSLCTAALLMLAACTNDPAEDLLSSNDTRPDALPEGTFVVDYLPSADLPATRGLGDDEVILSLDYLLYASKDDQEYTLQKHTSISDINAKTRWPLTRDNMTWQQRQELKDTLTTGSKYKVVFVANADKEKVWNDKTDFQPMTGVDNDADFDDARLLLPPNGDFQQQEDGKYTFYYMWTGEIDPTTNGYNKNTPAQMDVVLQRMVNKVEIRLEEQVVNGLKESASVEDYVKGKLDEYYKVNYVISTEGTMSGALYNVVDGYLNGIAQNKIGIDEKPGALATNEQKSKYTFQELLKNSDSKTKVVNSISGISSICTTGGTACCVWHQFVHECKDYFITRCDWSNLTSVSVNYTQQTFPYAIDFNMDTKADAPQGQSYTITAPKETTESNYDNRYVFYTFSNKGGVENINNVSSIIFYKDDTEAFTVTSSITPGNSPTEGNNHYFLTYQPITGRAISESQTFTFQREQYNMQNVIGWKWTDSMWDWGALNAGWQPNDMTGWVNGLFNNGDESNESSFQEFTLQLNIPKIEIATPWSTENASQTE